MSDDENGWERSAAAWIADMGESGDFSRSQILDAPMLARVRHYLETSGADRREALDIGCGEGRFCRMMAELGLRTTGIEPTPSLRLAAQTRHPEGRYLAARAEDLPFEPACFDLVVSYLTLIDIDGIEAAIAEMARVLRPGGQLLIANLNSFATAGEWRRHLDGAPYFRLDNYLEPRAEWVSWRGISIRNWHRPMQDYLTPLLAAGLRLAHFEEPVPQGAAAPGRGSRQVERARRVPYFHIMEWCKD